MTTKQIDPAKALDTFFGLVRREALANPTFGRQLVEALGCTVIYRGDEALAAMDPLLVATKGAEEFRRTFMSFKPADVKKAGEAAGFFAKKEALPKAHGQLVDLLWSRAQQRLRDLTPRYAAE